VPLARFRGQEDVVDIRPLFGNHVEVERGEPIFQVIQIEPAELQQPIGSPYDEGRFSRTDGCLADEFTTRLQNT
jgi:hypothetical protein